MKFYPANVAQFIHNDEKYKLEAENKEWGLTMWSMWAWEMKRKSCAMARCGHRPISKASFSDGKMTQVSWPAMDNPSTGYPSINNFLPARVSPGSSADTSGTLEMEFLGFPSISREPNSPTAVEIKKRSWDRTVKRGITEEKILSINHRSDEKATPRRGRWGFKQWGQEWVFSMGPYGLISPIGLTLSPCSTTISPICKIGLVMILLTQILNHPNYDLMGKNHRPTYKIDYMRYFRESLSVKLDAGHA